MDEHGQFHYFIVNSGLWGFGKKVMLPVGRIQIDNDGRHMRALGFTKEQTENLSEFNDSLKIDHNYEERVILTVFKGTFESKTAHWFLAFDSPGTGAIAYHGNRLPSQEKNCPLSSGRRCSITFNNWVTVRSTENSFSEGTFR